MNFPQPIISFKKNRLKKARLKDYETNTPVSLKQRLYSLLHLVGIKTLVHPWEFVDGLLGRYACRRRPLPCDVDGQLCVTFEDFQQVCWLDWISFESSKSNFVL